MFANQLEFAAALLKRDLGSNTHEVALLGVHFDATVGTPKHGASNLRVRIFQREVPVPGAGRCEIADFPFHGDPVKVALQEVFGFAIQFADR